MRIHLRREISAKEIPIEYLAFSAGYLEAAEQLNKSMLSGRWPSNFFRGLAAKLLAFHAVELFLKACILKASPGAKTRGHSIAELYEKFTKHYPNMSFDPLFQVKSLVPYPGLIEVTKLQNRHLHETLRYPADFDGQPWRGNRGFAPKIFKSTLARLRGELERVADEIFPDV